MVFIIHPKSARSFKKNVLYKLQSEMQEPDPAMSNIQEPDPIMSNIQKSTTVEQLENPESLKGSGFRVNGGSVRTESKPKNEKLRKFISLKIR